MHRQLKRYLLVLALSVFTASDAGPASADGMFVQSDLSAEDLVTSMNVQKDQTTSAMNVIANKDDQALLLSLTRPIPLDAVSEILRIGPAIRIAYEGGSFASTDVGVKVIYEDYVPTDFGALFFLADASSVGNSILLLGQVTITDQNLTFEVSYGQSDDYSDASVVLSRKLDGTPFSGRIGYRVQAGSVFIGLSFNSF